MRSQVIMNISATPGEQIPIDPVSVHVIGDLHVHDETIPSYINARAKAFFDDVENMPVPDFRIQVGDITEYAQTTPIAMANTFFSGVEAVQGFPIMKVAGNHDYMNDKVAADFEADYGNNPNWHIDVGSWLRLIGVSPLQIHNPNPGYINVDHLLSAADTDRMCVVFCHYPIYGTVGMSDDETSKHSEMPFYHAYTVNNVNNALVNRPNIKAWISGHTHSELSADNLLKEHSVGNRTIATISTSAVAHVPSRPVTLATPLCSPVLEIYHDRIEVTFRDHKTGGIAQVGGQDTTTLNFA